VIGNDIVDLEFLDQPLYQHVRHLRRVCSLTEARMVRDSADPSVRLAVVWAAKEAAYKLISRMRPDCHFVPRHFATQFEDSQDRDAALEGRVAFEELDVRVRVSITPRWVHAVATFEAPLAIRLAVAPVEEYCVSGSSAQRESAAVRKLAKDLLEQSGLVGATIANKGKIPSVVSDRGDANISLSLSHHGAFVAAAIAWPCGRVVDKTQVDFTAELQVPSEEVCSTCTA
jgi:phosphopantetheinyl transferase (holo-ACP synthase)